MKFLDLEQIKQLVNKYGRHPELYSDGMFCRNCNQVVKSYSPPQINYLTKTSVCGICGWVYSRFPIRNKVINQIFTTDNFECVYCSSKDRLTVEHIKPYFFGGSDELENLVTACRKCNYQRGNQLNFRPMIYGRFRG